MEDTQFEINPKTKILLVSSSHENRFNLKKLLKTTGLIEITEMENGIDALKECIKTPFEVVIVDMEVKFIAGWSFIKELKTNDKIPNCAVIFAGAGPCPVGPEDLKQYGIAGFLAVPFAIKELMKLFSSNLGELKTEGSLENKYTIAKDLLLKNQAKEAINRFEELRLMTQQSVRSSIGLAQSYEMDNQPERANEYIKEVVEKDPTSFSAMLVAVRMALQKNEVDIATKTIQQILETSKDTPLYAISCLDLTLKYNLFALAKKICEKSIKNGFKNNQFHIGLAKIEYALGNTDAALKTTLKVIKAVGPTLESLNLKGICFRKLGKFMESMKAYEEAMKISPMDSKLFFNMAITAYAMNDVELAIRYLETAVKITPNFDKAQEKLKEYKEAKFGKAS